MSRAAHIIVARSSDICELSVQKATLARVGKVHASRKTCGSLIMQFQSQHVEPLSGWNAAPLEPISDLASLWDTPSELWNLAANSDLPAQGQTTDPLAVQLGSVGSGTANFLDDLPAVVQPKRANSKEDRKLAVSREAQKRFRQRQKVLRWADLLCKQALGFASL